jgi:hypothetical protein
MNERGRGRTEEEVDVEIKCVRRRSESTYPALPYPTPLSAEAGGTKGYQQWSGLQSDTFETKLTC